MIFSNKDSFTMKPYYSFKPLFPCFEHSKEGSKSHTSKTNKSTMEKKNTSALRTRSRSWSLKIEFTENQRK